MHACTCKQSATAACFDRWGGNTHMIKVKRVYRKRVNRVAVTKSDSSGKRVTNGNVDMFHGTKLVENTRGTHVAYAEKRVFRLLYCKMRKIL